MARCILPLAGALALTLSGPVAASDFGLEYAVERAPATQLSMAQCAAAVKRGSQAAGYLTRIEQDQGASRIFVSGPKGDGRSLVAYCIQAGSTTVYVVQAFDYAGPGGVEAARVKQAVVTALKQATAVPRR